MSSIALGLLFQPPSSNFTDLKLTYFFPVVAFSRVGEGLEITISLHLSPSCRSASFQFYFGDESSDLLPDDSYRDHQYGLMLIMPMARKYKPRNTSLLVS